MQNTVQNTKSALNSLKSESSDLSEIKLAEAIRKTREYLLKVQHPEGYWESELKADTTLPSDYILMMHFLGMDRPEKVRKLTNFIRQHQLEDGSWNIYTGGPGEISATVKAYSALKMAGFSMDEPFMVKAREAIHNLGGIEKINSFAKLYLSLIGEYERSATPAIPPELILFPNWFYFNVYEFSSWSRAIIIPLSIIYAFKPIKPLPPGRGIDELFEKKARPKKMHFQRGFPLNWKNIFLFIDRILKIYEKSPIKPFRKTALKKAASWMLEHLEMSDGLGAIYPAMVNSIFALHCLGYKNDHPLVVRALKQLEDFEVEENDTLRLQPCLSPVWDTAISLVALTELEFDPNHPALQKAVSWLMEKQVRHAGDWKVKVPHVEPAGWYFEFRNEFYPDVDDTFMVLIALKKIHDRAQSWPRDLVLEMEDAMQKSIRWVRAMQNKDGGWASFDLNNNKVIFTKVPYADHNAMIDPSTVDITARGLEMFGIYGFDKTDPQVPKAIAYIKKEQEPDGCWYGRWGVNYIYGTWQVLRGLSVIGEDLSQDYCQKAVQWLKTHQNTDGGWGETLKTYDDPGLRGTGESTPSQTAWALMGLFAAGDTTSENVNRGLSYLVNTQKPDGTWDEIPLTGTGFPKVFYLKYEYYKIYFPLLALSYYTRLQKA